MARKVVAQTQARGEAETQFVVDALCLTKNSVLRHGVYSPSHRVLGEAPSEPPSLMSDDQFAELGVVEDQVDPESRLAFQHQARLEAKKTLYMCTLAKECSVHYSGVQNLSLKRSL